MLHKNYEQHRATRNEIREQRRKDGLCAYCAKHSGKAFFCADCRRDHTENTKAWRARKKLGTKASKWKRVA